MFRSVFGDESTSMRYPVWNRIILCYVGLSLIVFVLFLIAPVVTFAAKTPLYHIKRYLGLLGGALILVDVFTNRVLWRGPWCVLLYMICVLSAVASVRTIEYGIRTNLFMIAWTLIQMSLFYSCCFRTDRESLRCYLGRLFAIVMVIWTVACAVSIYQYLFKIKYLYVVDPRSDDLSTARQGFMENRLFGIFNPLNHAAYVSVMLFFVGLYYLVRSRKAAPIVLLVIGELATACHVILSGSRSAMVSLLFCSALFGFAIVKSRVPGRMAKRIVLAFGSAVICTCLAFGVYTVSKSALSLLPSAISQTESTGQKSGKNGKNQKKPKEENDDILERTDIEDNVSNNRFRIWKDYLSLYDEVGLVGLSPGNYMSYIRNHDPDLYIVRYIRENFPEKYEGGIIYHVHNGYLMAFVSSGILGAALAGLFLILCVIRALKHLFSRKRISAEVIACFCVVSAGCINAMFDSGVFFHDSAPTFIFWIALGLLMKKTAATAALEPQRGGEVS